MTYLSIYPLAQVQRGSLDFSDSDCWVYLGKDLGVRDALTHVLGEKRLLPLNDRLHALAEHLRQPYLDFIADMGKIQADQIGWWSSSSSWKSMGRSDLFLLICYEHLVGVLLREFKGCDRRLVIVVEDPWLFRQLRDAYGGFREVQFHGVPSVWPDCLRALVLGVGARAVWSIRLLLSHLRQRWFWPRSKTSAPSSPCIALYSYPQERCLHGADEWTDPYLGDLDKLLEKAGYAVLRFSPPEVGGFEWALSQRSHYFSPLILWITPLSLIRSVSASWRPVWPRDPQVGGLPICKLLQRDWQLDRWRSSYPLFRVFFDSLSNFLAARQLQLLVYPYENQPWERLLVLAARDHGVPTLGYQHGGGLARFMFPYFHGSRETEWAPVPDLIVTSGTYSYELLAEGGIPRDRLVLGGNLRHQYIWDSLNPIPLPSARSRVRVLVALPVDRDLVQHLLRALRKAFPDGGINEGVEFAIKPHPMCPVTESAVNWPAAIVGGTFSEALRSCAVVLFSGSGTGMEALAMGRAVLRYRSELLFNMDRAELLDTNAMVDCGDYDLRGKLLSILHGTLPSHTRQDVDNLLKQVFTQPDSTVWLHAIQRTALDASTSK